MDSKERRAEKRRDRQTKGPVTRFLYVGDIAARTPNIQTMLIDHDGFPIVWGEVVVSEWSRLCPEWIQLEATYPVKKLCVGRDWAEYLRGRGISVATIASRAQKPESIE